MATVYRRGKTWWGRFTYNTKELRRSLETASRSIALKRLSKWESEVKAVRWGDGAGRTYDEAMTSFLDNHCPTLRKSSRTRYELSAKHLTGFFSGLPLSQITSSRMADYEALRRRNDAMAPTIRRDLACLSSMFTHAIIDREWCEHNPVLSFLKRQKRRGRLKESPPKTRYLTVEEERNLLAACLTDKLGNPIPDGKNLANAIAFAIDTGLRAEEQWSLTLDRVTIRRDKKKVAGGEVKITKEIAKGKRERRIPLFPRAAQIAAQQPTHKEDGTPYPTVFVNAKGKKLIGRNKGLKEAAKRAKLAKLTWHDLRRTCGCRLLQDHRFSLEQVRDWLGHESVQQTERAYAFLKVDALQTAVQESAQGVGFSKSKGRRKPRK